MESKWNMLIFFIWFFIASFAYGIPSEKVSGGLPGYAVSPYYDEQVITFKYSSDILIHINAPSADKFDGNKPVGLALYALPNGNTTEQTIGKVLEAGDDWHFDIQHIGAQTRFLRGEVSDYNLVVVYLETTQKSWPSWKGQHTNHAALVKSLVEYLKSTFSAYDPFIILTGHSGGGRFTFSFMDAFSDIPDYVDRICFLDSNYGYEHSYGDKMIRWLNASPDHYLSVIAYNDSVALYNGQPIVSATGGTWYRSRIMQRYFSNNFTFTHEENDAFIRHSALNGRIRFELKKNPEKKILHTVQVERNGFIHGLLTGTERENLTYTYYGDRIYTDLIQTGIYVHNGMMIPPRSSGAVSGSEFMQSVMDMNFDNREAAIFNEISAGNIPNFLRELKTLETSFLDANGFSHQISYEVMPDYLAIGSDSDYCRIPMGPATAQKIADLFGATMPTRKLVNHIYVNSDIKLEPVTYPWSEESTKVPRFIQHNADIEALRLAAGGIPGQLMGGLKKDVVISNKIAELPNNVVIYGWHKLDGTPWQPLYNGHIASYVDYSHGIRLLNVKFMIDGQEKNVRDALRDPVLYKVLSDETGVMSQPTYIADTTLPAKPKSFGVKTEHDGSVKILIKPDPSVDSYRLYLSPDGLTFNDPVNFEGSEFTPELTADDSILFFKLQAVNTAGFSAETEVLAVHVKQGEMPESLIVYGFDRASTGNTYNFIRQHGNAMSANDMAFDSATNEAITDGLFDLQDYRIVDYVLGDESTVDETFSAAEQTRVKTFLKGGGALFVSGAEIAWDLDYKGSATDKDFFYNYLKAQYTADAPGNVSATHYTAEGLEDGLFEGLNSISFDNGTHGTINVKWADAITGVNGGKNVVKYKNVSTHTIGGVSYEGSFPGGTATGKVVYLGFPFETVYPEDTRNMMMMKIRDFFRAEPSSVHDFENHLPQHVYLSQNYPNPFNPVTTIDYGIPENTWVTVSIYDIKGRLINTLIDEYQQPGSYSIQWKGHAQNGSTVSSGMYLYQLQTGSYSTFKKMMFIK